MFEFVSDPTRDPTWCPKVQSVRPRSSGPAKPGARYEVIHRPIPFLAPRTMDHLLVEWVPPSRIVWRDTDAADTIKITYELAALGPQTRFTQRDNARLGAPRILHPILRVGIRHDIATQLKRLKRYLEAS